MSFFDKIKAGAVIAASMAADVAKITADAAKQTYTQLKSTPTQVQCKGCGTQVSVPVDAWNWRCEIGHENGDVKACTTCGQPKPKTPNPTVSCPTCSTVTDCPSTVIWESIRNAPTNTKKIVVEGVNSVKKDVQQLRSAPSEFKCVHCQTLLAVPMVPWQCQTCNFRNGPEVERCNSCQQTRAQQKVLCGVCRRSTPVPSSNFAAQLYDVKVSAKESVKKVYYKVSKATFTTCPRCNTHVSFQKVGDESATDPINVPAKVSCPSCGADVAHPMAEGAEGAEAASSADSSSDASSTPNPYTPESFSSLAAASLESSSQPSNPEQVQAAAAPTQEP
jgi:hypothetical protein